MGVFGLTTDRILTSRSFGQIMIKAENKLFKNVAFLSLYGPK